MLNIAIIGTGMTGITLADFLRKKTRIKIFEKSRGVGGRMAIRRATPYKFSHGAQLFKIESSSFKNFLGPLLSENIVKPSNTVNVQIKNKVISKLNSKYYVGVPNSNSILKFFLKNDLSLNLSCKIQRIKRFKKKWYIYDSDKVSYGPFDWLVLSIPPRQAVDIICKDFKYLNTLKKIKMKSCFSLMLGFKEFKTLSYDKALLIDEDVSWLSVDKTSDGNSNFYNVLINSSYNYANKNIKGCHEKISNYLIKKTSDILNYKLNNHDYKSLHFWRYATSEKNNNYGSFLDESNNIIVCGDWCMNGKIEGAFLSAKDAISKFYKYI